MFARKVLVKALSSAYAVEMVHGSAVLPSYRARVRRRLENRPAAIESEPPVDLLGLMRDCAGSNLPSAAAILGLTASGRPLLLRLSSPEVGNVLVAGTGGSGKTALLRSIAVSLACQNPQRRLQMVLIDPKGRGLWPLAGLPHSLAHLISDHHQAADWLEYLAELMQRRHRQRVCEPTLAVIVDELADLMQRGGQSVADALTRLAQRGPEAGIHLVCGTRKPSARAMGSLLKATFAVRLVGRVAGSEDARIAAGIGGTGAERLRGAGGFAAVAGGRVTRFRAAYLPDHQVVEVVASLRDRLVRIPGPPARPEDSWRVAAA